MAEEDFKEGFIKFGNNAVYFIFDIVSFDISCNMAPLQWRAASLPDKCHFFVLLCI
jgi:hypothetical protein